MSSYEKFTKDVGLIGLTNLILAFRGLILLPIISKIIGPSGYGIWALVGVTLGLVAPIYEMGLTTSFIRFIAAEKDKREIQEGFFSVFFVMICCSSVIALLLLYLSNPLSNLFFGGADAALIVQITAIIVPFSAMSTGCSGYFIAFRQMKTYSLFTIAQNFGEFVLIAGSVLSGFGIIGIVFSLLVVRVLTSSIALYIILSQIGIKRPNFSHLKSYLKFGLPLLPTNIFAWVTELSDRYIIGYFLGITSVGIYSVGYGLVGFIRSFRVPLTHVLGPTLSKSYDEGKNIETQAYLRYSLKYFLTLAIPCVFGLSLLGKQILRIFTTSEFVSGYIVIPFVAIAILLYGVYATTGAQVLKLAKKTKVLGSIWCIAGLANLGLNIVFVPRFGIFAAAATTLFSYTLATCITMYFAFQQFTFKIDWIFILKSLVASGAMSLVIIGLNPTQAGEVLLVVGLGAAVYGITLFLLKSFDNNEIKFFIQLLRKNFQMSNRRP